VAPGLPALAESGVPNYDLTVWQILYARPGTPPEIVSLLSEAARKAVADPAVQQRLAAAGCETWPDTSPAAAAAWLAEDIARWAPIAAKVTPG
jgi:tripartite-type tricarboxylate transporter receptor subunit TctC